MRFVWQDALRYFGISGLALCALHTIPAVAEDAFIVPPDTWPANHGSTLARSGDELLACWFAGSDEGEEDVSIVCSARQDRSEWSSPWTPVAPQERAEGSWLANKFVGNPVL